MEDDAAGDAAAALKADGTEMSGFRLHPSSAIQIARIFVRKPPSAFALW